MKSAVFTVPAILEVLTGHQRDSVLVRGAFLASISFGRDSTPQKREAIAGCFE